MSKAANFDSDADDSPDSPMTLIPWLTEVRQEIAAETEGMTFAELQRYYRAARVHFRLETEEPDDS